MSFIANDVAIELGAQSPESDLQYIDEHLRSISHGVLPLGTPRNVFEEVC